MRQWHTDEELFDLARRELFTAVVGDAMDKAGLRRQFLPPQIKPLSPAQVVIGRAMTVLEADMVAEPAEGRAFGLMFQALDDLKPGEVYLCAGASPNYALWGELMSLRALRLGAAGAVLDGYSRDTAGILALKFPTFSYGAYAQDQAPRGQVIDFRVPVDIGQVHVEPGDLVFGDLDGVCVVPRGAVDDIFQQALEKARTENQVRQAIEGGMSASEAFTQFKVM
jgi:regulator of RNase E activity RraA